MLATSTASQFKTFVSTLPRKDGTLLYYAVDDALDMLEAYSFPTVLGSVNLVTFTDGLDQGSLMMNPAYTTDQQYLNSVSQRISDMKVRGLPLTAYSLGLRGSDVTDYLMFRNNLIRLASSSDKATEAGSMAEVQSRLQEIADRIISISTRQSITAKIPGTSNGAQICFTLDGETPANSSMYIMGTFNLSDFSLRNVTYHGIRGESSVVQGTREGIFLTFTFSGLQREDGNGLIPTTQIRQYNKAATSSTWQVNSEFSSANNTQTTTTHTGAAIVLVLDCSNSLGTQFSNMQGYVQDFIGRVANNTASYTLAAPDNVTAALDDESFQISVCWNAVKHAESYDVYRSSSSTGNFEKVAEGIMSTSWTDEQPQYSNFYKVCAVGHGLTSKMSVVSARVVIPSLDGNFDANGVSFKMIKVTGGTFQMGTKGSEVDEQPVHNVTLSDYYIGKTEVTQELWQAVMGSNPSNFKGDNLPVESVSWNDCQTFITKLNELTGQNFRLPTEAEWEFAAKGGTQSKGYTYSGSNTLGDVAWYTSNSSDKTHEVATKAPNELGIYDMSGNVWEWCQDWYDSYSSSSQTNPTGPSSGYYRVNRGGSWSYNATNCRTANRSHNSPTYSNNRAGFRLALKNGKI